MGEHTNAVHVGKERVAALPGVGADQRQAGADFLHRIARDRIVDETRGQVEQLQHGEACALLGIAGTNQQAQRQDAQEPTVVALTLLVGLDRFGELEELDVLLCRHELAQCLRGVAHDLGLAIPGELEQPAQAVLETRLVLARISGVDHAAPGAVLALGSLELLGRRIGQHLLANLLHLLIVAPELQQLGQHAVADRGAGVFQQPRYRVGAQRGLPVGHA